jgi:hypothetical protein
MDAVPVRSTVIRHPIFLRAVRAEAEVFDGNFRREDAEPGMNGAPALSAHVAPNLFVPFTRHERSKVWQNRMLINQLRDRVGFWREL